MQIRLLPLGHHQDAVFPVAEDRPEKRLHVLLPGPLRPGQLLFQQPEQTAALLLHHLEGKILQRVKKRVEIGLGNPHRRGELRQVQPLQTLAYGHIQPRVQQSLPHPGPVLLRIGLAGHGIPSPFSSGASITQFPGKENRSAAHPPKSNPAAVRGRVAFEDLTPPAWACLGACTWSFSPPGGYSHTRCSGTGGRKGVFSIHRPCTPCRSPGSPLPSG